jgi:tRNA A-37 threonylcarbamoyl transferase component Bud32
MGSTTAATLVRNTAPALPHELASDWAASWPGWFGPARTPLPRAPEKAHLALVETPLGRVVAKREEPAGWRQSLVVLHARPLRSVLAFERAAELARHALGTPEALCVIERRTPMHCEAVLVTRYVDGLGPWEHLRRGGDPAALSRALGRALASLHRAGFRHRDLKESNLLLRDGADGLEVVWTDLDGLRALGEVGFSVRTRDLARLSVSFESSAARQAGVRRDHWPALVGVYLAETLGREPTADEIGRTLARTRRWAERSIRRHLAHGRPVA